MKKVLSFVMALGMIGAAVPVVEIAQDYSFSASAEDYVNGTYNNLFSYKLYSDHIEITKAIGVPDKIGNKNDPVAVEVPSKIEGLPVTVIGGKAFYSKNISSVKLPNTLTEIGELAFNSCPMASIAIPESVTKIGNGCFKNCNFTSITLPKNLEAVPDNAFDHSKLEEIVLPESIISIGMDAFGFTPLKNIVIPDKVENIGKYAFRFCSNLKSVKLPANLIEIGEEAFTDCNLVTEIEIPDKVEKIGFKAFANCDLKEIVFPSSVSDIGGDTLKGCKNLNSVTFYNPDCHIGGDWDAHSVYSAEEHKFVNYPFLGTIYGYSGSTAEDFAKRNNYRFKALAGSPPVSLGDMNNDGEINALDASNVLSAYAKLATGGTITDTEKRTADVNKDGEVNSLDASLILGYYAYTATGGKDSLSTFLKK